MIGDRLLRFYWRLGQIGDHVNGTFRDYWIQVCGRHLYFLDPPTRSVISLQRGWLADVSSNGLA